MYLVRAAEVADAAQLRRFSCSGPKYTKWTKRVEKIIRANLADALLDPHRSIEALVAISDKDEMAGVVAMEPAADAPEIWMVHVLGVTEDHRRSGVGRTLMKHSTYAGIEGEHLRSWTFIGATKLHKVSFERLRQCSRSTRRTLPT